MLATLYESAGMYEEALAAYKNYESAEDSLFNTDSQAIISELQTRYRTKEQEQAILLLQREQAIQRLWLGGLVGGMALLGVIAFLGYTGYRSKKKALHELDQTYTKLKTTQDQLVHQEKLASLGQITAGIAHEIKNPLNFVNNFSQINEELIEEIQSSDQIGDEELQELIENLKVNQLRISRHGERANGIVESMMQHASQSNGERKRVDANAFTQEYIYIAHNGIHSQNSAIVVDLHEEYDEKACEIELVPQDLGQVIVNLYKNAYDALVEHASSMVDSFKPRITVSTKQTNNSFIITVADNGPGIPDTLASKIFEPFFTTKETGKGTGLGLSLSHDIVTQGHGGQLTLESEEGMGAVFSIVLPKLNLLMPMGGERLYTEKEISTILKRAGEQQAKKGDQETVGLSLQEIQQIAKEVGLDPSIVASVAVELDRTPDKEGGTPWYKVPRKVAVERVLPGKISEDQWPDIVSAIESELGVSGASSQIGRMLEWTYSGKSVHYKISFTASEDQTKVRFFHDFSTRATALTSVFLIYGLGGGIATGVSLLNNPMGLPFGLVIAFIVYMLVRFGLTWYADKKRRSIQQLLSRFERDFVEAPNSALSTTTANSQTAKISIPGEEKTQEKSGKTPVRKRIN